MAGAPHWNFAAFRLDLDNACVWHGTELLALRPKTFTVLLHLVTHAGQLVTKEALLEAVWPQTAVSDTVLKDCMHELRRALGDTARTPQLIATVHRRGYRFIAPVTVMESVAATEAQTMRSGERAAFTPALALPSVSGHAPTSSLQLVARETEIATLHQWFTKAHQGERHLGFLTGEAGIGKTTLVNAFVAQCAGQGPLWLGHGQCIEQYGTGEAYLPLLAALGQMGRSPDGPQLVALLRQHAPSWLLHLPALLSPQDAEALQRYAGGTTRERMLRELAEAMEVLTADRPGILVLEDLHWGDTATIEWLAYMARRRRPARLLVLGTYRPVEALVRAHPVRAMVQELTLHGYGAELALGEWSEVGVAAYLAHRGAGTAGPAALARVLTQRTEGHPLFLATVVDELLRQGVVRVEPTGWVLTRGIEAVTVGVPPSLRAWLEHQMAQLRPEAQELLAAASVAGVEFAIAAVAAAVQQAEEEVETQCDALARQSQVVQARGTVVWPDGTVTARYGFRHALYQELLYDQVPVSRRLRWHQQIGRRHEAGYGDRAWEVAAELAMHFGRGQDAPRAVRYLRQAADNALRRAAPSAAIRALTQAQALVSLLSDAHEQARQELAVQLTLGAACVATQGAGAPAVAQAYARALELSQQVGEPSQRCLALLGVAWVALVRGQALNAQELAAQALAHGHALPDSVGRASAHALLGSALSFLGALETARRHLEQSLRFLHIQQSPAPGITRPEDLEVFCLARLAEVLWLLGYPDQALHRSQEALARADALASPASLALARIFAARLHQYRREPLQVSRQAEAALALAGEQPLALRQAQARVLRGWALVMLGQKAPGMMQLQQGLAAVRATGEGIERPYRLALLAEAWSQCGQPARGVEALTEALELSRASGEHRWEAEIHRLHGACLLAGRGDGDSAAAAAAAETCFQQALTIACRQQAKSLELRTTLSLARLWQRQGKRTAAYELLAPIYGWFTAGFDTADLQEAKVLLDELRG